MSRRTVVVTIALVVAALATAGSGPAHRRASERLPDPSAFRPGTCRTVAGPVLTLARLDRTLRDAPALPSADRGRITDAQRQLLGAPADPALAGPLRDLVTAVGYVRLRADTGSYSAAVWRDADARRRAVQRACVRG
ncbi:MAG TPA: hypothetical protein VGD72_10665 [Mycobacteriales bacterium]|jgi:hypothetical protein